MRRMMLWLARKNSTPQEIVNLRLAGRLPDQGRILTRFDDDFAKLHRNCELYGRKQLRQIVVYEGKI